MLLKPTVELHLDLLIMLTTVVTVTKPMTTLTMTIRAFAIVSKFL